MSRAVAGWLNYQPVSESKGTWFDWESFSSVLWKRVKGVILQVKVM